MKIDKGDLQFRKVMYSLIKNEKKGKAYPSLLDIGPGKGQLTEMYYHLGFQVSCVDIDPSILELDTVPCTKIDMNFDKLPFKDERFDYVTCTEIIEHLENPYNLVKEASRVLKKGGKLIISTPYTGSLIQKIYYLLTGFFLRFSKTPQEGGHLTPINFYFLKYMLKKNDLEIEKITYNRGWIPLLRIEAPRISMFGDIIIIKTRKE